MDFRNTFKAGTCAIAGSGLLLSPVSLHAKTSEDAAEKNVVRLAPSGPWNINFADDSCRLARLFGEGDDQVALYLERYEPGDWFSMIVAGTPLKTNRNRVATEVQFGVDNEVQKTKILLGNLGERDPALIFSSIRFIAIDDAEGDATDQEETDEGGADVFGQTIAPETEKAITWIRVKRRFGKTVYLNTGSMGDPMMAMRQCTDNLLTTWGIDLEKHRKLAQLPQPKTRPGRWLTSKDYPAAMLKQWYQGWVKFRLSVNEEGKPTACHIQQSTRPQDFDDAVCDGLMRRARFKPAETKDGEKIASYWRSTVRFDMP